MILNCEKEEKNRQMTSDHHKWLTQLAPDVYVQHIKHASKQLHQHCTHSTYDVTRGAGECKMDANFYI